MWYHLLKVAKVRGQDLLREAIYYVPFVKYGGQRFHNFTYTTFLIEKM